MILSFSSWYYCVNLGHNVIIIMILLFLFGARCHYHHDIFGAQWGNLMIPLYDIIVFLFLGGFFPRRGPSNSSSSSSSSSSSRRPPPLGTTVLAKIHHK